MVQSVHLGLGLDPGGTWWKPLVTRKTEKTTQKNLPFHTFNRDAFILTLRDLQQSSGQDNWSKGGHRYEISIAARVNRNQSCFIMFHISTLYSSYSANPHLFARVGANSLRQGLCRSSEMQIGAGGAVSR